MSEKKQVLIICRTAAGQMYLGVLLNRIWYLPILARTVEEGVRLAQANRFSLVIFDGDLAENELQSSLALLRNDPVLNRVPLAVFLTAENTVKAESLLTQGCSAVLTKPLDLALVYGVLGQLSGQPRSAPRVPVRMRVEILEGKPEKALASVNLSDGGMYLRTHAPLPEGAVIHLKFTLPRDVEPIQLAGEVVRTSPLGIQVESEPGMGLRFLDMPESVKQKLRNFVQWEMVGDLEWEAKI